MRCLNRNKTRFHYKTVVSSTMNMVDGYFNGTFARQYSAMKVARMSVQPARSEFAQGMAGIMNDFTMTIVTDDRKTDIDVGTILWIGVPTTGPHNYVVTSKSVSLNSATIGIKEVSASA